MAAPAPLAQGGLPGSAHPQIAPEERQRRLRGSLGRLIAEGTTVVLITHRMAMARGADWIVAFGPGGTEQGTHEELAAAGGTYAGLLAGELETRRGVHG